MEKKMDRGDLGDPCNPDDIEPEHGLITWEKWVKDRQQRTKELGKSTNRPPADLVMNLCENVREDRERKEVLQNVQVRRKLGTCRGSLWDPPERLLQHCYCEPVYEVHRTKAEVGRPPVIEHIGVPQAIQVEEKGMTGTPERQPCEKLDEGYERYRKIREEKYKNKIKKIDPFRPRLSGLIVKGKRPEPPPPKPPPLPTITVTPPSPACTCEADANIFALRINNSVFSKHERGWSVPAISRMRDEPWHEDCTSWYYYFNVPERRAGRAKLFLHNLGTVSIRYCWKKIKKPIPYVPEDLYEQVFFFNKNEDVLYPGEIRDFCFTFISDKRGIFSEFWELSTMNVHFLNDAKFTIYLSGDATDNIPTNTARIQRLQSRLESKANKFCIARKILLDLIDDATTVEPLAYPYKNMFVEADIFVIRNPIYYYHQSEVEKMKQTFKEMIPGGEWDLYVSDWRSVMKDKMFEQRMQYYDLLKKSHKVMLRPWFEVESLLDQKHCIVKLLLGRLADEFDKEYKALSMLYNIVGMDSVSVQERLDNRADVSMKANVFYIHMLEHVGNTMELCAGALGSLERNRWIDLNFCRKDENNDIDLSKSQHLAATLPSTPSIKM